jgi:DNA mismatch endonuclease (patch repair protein)
MTDIVSSAKRSEIMRAVRSENTAPELALARLLRRMHIRYRRYLKSLPGRPDFLLPDLHTAILVHGCFWHQHKNCRRARLPKSNTKFWSKKFRRNVARDARIVGALRRRGLRVVTIWECAFGDLRNVASRLERAEQRAWNKKEGF